MAYPTPSTSSPSQTGPSDANNNKVGFDDPTSKVLPAALKKNKIREEDWDSYVMLITYGPPGNVIL